MQKVNAHEAQTHLFELLKAAIEGETVLIVDDDQQTVQLVPLPQRRPKRKFGSGAGLMATRGDFDEPLDDFREYME